jgi:hypothetical protein
MPVKSDALLSLWDIENMPACDEGMELARRFLEAAGECVTHSVLAERARAVRTYRGHTTLWSFTVIVAISVTRFDPAHAGAWPLNLSPS